MMVVFFLGTGLSAILVGFANNEIQIVLSFALVGFFGSIYHPVGIAWIARTINNRGKALGINGVFLASRDGNSTHYGGDFDRSLFMAGGLYNPRYFLRCNRRYTSNIFF